MCSWLSSISFAANNVTFLENTETLLNNRAKFEDNID